MSPGRVADRRGDVLQPLRLGLDDLEHHRLEVAAVPGRCGSLLAASLHLLQGHPDFLLELLVRLAVLAQHLHQFPAQPGQRRVLVVQGQVLGDRLVGRGDRAGHAGKRRLLVVEGELLDQGVDPAPASPSGADRSCRSVPRPAGTKRLPCCPRRTPAAPASADIPVPWTLPRAAPSETRWNRRAKGGGRAGCPCRRASPAPGTSPSPPP